MIQVKPMTFFHLSIYVASFIPFFPSITQKTIFWNPKFRSTHFSQGSRLLDRNRWELVQPESYFLEASIQFSSVDVCLDLNNTNYFLFAVLTTSKYLLNLRCFCWNEEWKINKRRFQLIPSSGEIKKIGGEGLWWIKKKYFRGKIVEKQPSTKAGTQAGEASADRKWGFEGQQ